MTNLVFLHGWGTSGHIWRRQTAALARAGLTVLTPTFPSWEVSWLVDYLKKLPLAETVVVGWSLGGMLLIEALAIGNLTPATSGAGGDAGLLLRRRGSPSGTIPGGGAGSAPDGAPGPQPGPG